MGHLVELGRGHTAVFAAALPAHLAPTHIVGQDINDVGLLAESFLKGGKLVIDLLVLLRPVFCIPLLMVQEGSVWLISVHCRGKYE